VCSSDLLAGVLAHPRIRPHFHLSIQSGSDRILEKMRRSYNARRVEEAAALLRSVKGDPFLGCDIITGFPGETSGEFEKTRELCRRIGFSWIHAFPYSPRPGTEAWGFSGAVSEGEAVKRVRTLLDLGRRGREAYIGRWTGRTVGAIIQTKTKKTAGNFAAVSDNNLRLLIAAPPAEELVPKQGCVCRITGSFFGRAESGFDASAVWVENRGS
jgi:threonylcarbamoyladenosine tRNA methylthiotransferase MtaB